MDFNKYDSNMGRSGSFRPGPYHRPQESNVAMSRDLPHRRQGREHDPSRYGTGNMHGDISIPNISIPPETQRPSYHRPTFQQTPYPNRGLPATPASPHIVTPHTPLYATAAMDHGNPMMMPGGSPARPSPQHYPQQYGFNNGYPGRSSRGNMMNDRGFNQVCEPEMDDNHMFQDYPQQFSSVYNKSYQQQQQQQQQQQRQLEFNPFLAGPMHYNTSPNRDLYEGRRVTGVEPMQVAEQVKFSSLSIRQEEPTAGTAGARTSVASAAVSAPVVVIKKPEQVTIESAVKEEPQRVDTLRTLTGPIEKAVKWNTLLKGNKIVLYEIIAPFVAVHPGNLKGDKMILLREPSSPALQCFFQEIDVVVPTFRPGQLVRCVGKMMAKTKLRAFSIRPATVAEKTCLQRLQFICNRLVNDL